LDVVGWFTGGGLNVVAVGLHWGWVQAWWDYPDLSQEQRLPQFNETFADIAAARGMTFPPNGAIAVDLPTLA
jgi:cephalosporin-C deacetylase-like acetyl esterase